MFGDIMNKQEIDNAYLSLKISIEDYKKITGINHDDIKFDSILDQARHDHTIGKITKIQYCEAVGVPWVPQLKEARWPFAGLTWWMSREEHSKHKFEQEERTRKRMKELKIKELKKM